VARSGPEWIEGRGVQTTVAFHWINRQKTADVPVVVMASRLQLSGRRSVTRQIDLAAAVLAEQDDSSVDAVVVGRRVLADASGDW
jgi:hypothetical protein